MANNLAELCLCSSALWKVELLSGEIGHLAEEISKQSVEEMVRFLLTAYCKMQKERNELTMELLGEKEPEFKELEISQPVHITKK